MLRHMRFSVPNRKTASSLAVHDSAVIDPIRASFPSDSVAPKSFLQRLGHLLLATVAVLIPGAFLLLAAIMVLAAVLQASTARAYQSASLCTAAESPECYALIEGSIKSAQASSETAVDISVSDTTASTWVRTTPAQAEALVPGAAVMVQRFRGQIAQVWIQDWKLVARDNPTLVEQNDQIAAWVLGVPSLIWLAFGSLVVFRRRHLRPRVPSASTRSVATPIPQPFDAVFGAPAVPPSATVNLPLVLRSRGDRNRPWWLAPVLLVVFLPGVPLRTHASTQAVIVTFFVGLALAPLLAVVLYGYANRRRLVVDDLNVSFVNARGQAKLIARNDVTRVALRSVSTGRLTDDRLFLIGTEGRCLLALRNFNLTPDEATLLAAVLRVPIDPTWDRPATVQALEREIPGATPWSERHPMVIALPLIVVIGAIVFFFTFLSNR